MPVMDVSLVAMDLREFKIFREMIQRHTGIWLRDGKEAMLAARLARRLRHHGMSDYTSYAAYLEQVQDGGRELGEIINCVTTNKTSFFREMHHFDFLARTLVPELQAGAALGRKKSIRVWSAACSTGEEPYSIAVSLLEALQTGSAQSSPGATQVVSAPGGWQIDVVASDIDTAVLATAAQGIYAEESLVDVPAAAQKKYFLRGKGEMSSRARVKKELAALVNFQRRNLQDADWALDGLFDAIFFRNALIYFNRETQERFLRKMLGHLKPGGYLILGHSEHVPWLNDAVVAIGNTVHQLRPRKGSKHSGPSRPRS